MMPTNVFEASDSICNNCNTIQSHASSPFILALIQIKLIKYPLFSFIEILSCTVLFNPYPANVENMVSSTIMPANGSWDLTWRLKD
jgi:hypothetical protein